MRKVSRANETYDLNYRNAATGCLGCGLPKGKTTGKCSEMDGPECKQRQREKSRGTGADYTDLSQGSPAHQAAKKPVLRHDEAPACAHCGHVGAEGDELLFAPSRNSHLLNPYVCSDEDRCYDREHGLTARDTRWDDVHEGAKKEDGGKFKPPAGAQSAARKALKWIEDGKAGSGFTSVGRTRAHQLANGESLSLSTVKRMHSFFSRHRVDKQGKDWDKPSAGKVAWYAWGGDAGASWAKSIVEKHDGKKKEASVFEYRYASEDDGDHYQYIHKRGDSWVITQKGTGKVLSHHDTREKAISAFKAMMTHKTQG